MASKERENFYKNSTLIVDHAKDSLVDVLELHLTLKSLSFKDFINLHQHDIYHLCFNKRQCCQCPQGYALPHNRVVYPSQLEILLDKYGVARSCHVPRRRADFCCCLSKPGVTTNVLDITLARCLLINFCDDVFWHSCLTLRSNTLEDFLNQNQHQLYHLANVSTPCCRCPPGYVFSVARPLLDLHQWNFLFNARALPCALHRNILNSNICWVLASSGIDVIHLSKDLSSTILEQCCSLRKNIDTLLQMRNNVYGHAKEGSITDVNYRIYKNEIESAILEIAKVCGNETEKRQILMDLEKRSLDEALCIQYQNTLLEHIAKDTQLEEKLDDLAEKIPEIVDKAVVKALGGDTEQNLTKDQQIRKKKLKEDTHNYIQTHITEETFVKTNLISKGFQKLKQNGIVILTGIPGIGKSRNSLELLRTFCAEIQDYSAISLQRRSEWSELINDDDNLIVLIDDIFGRTNITFDGNEDLKLLDIIYSTIQRGTVKVILTMRNTIKLSLSDVVDSHRMLKDVNFLDISSDRLQMSTYEKENCLLNYCKKNNIWEQKSYTEKINSDDIAISDPDVPVYLSRKQIRAIAEINVCPLLGFPESCYLFSSNRKFTIQGVAFFKHPTQTLCDEISNIRTLGKHDDSKALEYALLVYIMLNGDCVDRLKINCEKVKQVIESIYGPSSIQLTTMNMKYCLELLMGRYLKWKEDNTVCFQHRTIFESVLLSCKDINPELITPLLDKDFLLELGCPEKYEPKSGEVTFKFYLESYQQLVSQLITYLKLAPSPRGFIKALCSSRIIRYADKSMLEMLYNAYKNSKVDVYLRRRKLLSNHVMFSDDRYEYGRHFSEEGLPYSLLEDMLQYSINFTGNTNVIINILDLLNKEMNMCNALSTRERNTYLFTHVLLQSCTRNNIARLDVILKFIKTKRIKLDEEIILWFDIKGVRVDMFKHFVKNVEECELIDVNVLMKRVVGLDDVSLVRVIIEQCNCKSYDIQSAMNTACEKGSVNIVRLFCEHFDLSVFNMQSLLLTVCARGHTEIVKLLLDKADHKMFDLDDAIYKSMKDHFNIAYVLLTSTNHSFKVKEIMDTILYHYVRYFDKMINFTDCFILVKYLLETNSISNFDLKVVIEIAGLSNDSDILQLVLEMMDINDFYQIWRKAKHFKCHRAMVLERLFESGCCTHKDVLKWMNTEMRYHDVNGMKYLMKKFDCKYFDINAVIEYSFSGGHSCPDSSHSDIDLRTENSFGGGHSCPDSSHSDIDLGTENLVDGGHSCPGSSHSDIDLRTECSFGSSYLWSTNSFFDSSSYFLLDNNMDCTFRNEYSPISHDYPSELILWMLETFGYHRFDVHSILEMALNHESWNLVEWILVNIDPKMLDIKLVIQSVTKYSRNRNLLNWMLEKFDHRLFDLQSLMTNACTHDNISLVGSMTDRFGIEMFQSRNIIMQCAIRHGCSDIVKLCLKNSHNIGEYNMTEVFNMACRQRRTELIKWLLVHYDHVHFHFNSAFTEIFKSSKCNYRKASSYSFFSVYNERIPSRFSFIYSLLVILDHTFLDIESIIQDLCKEKEFDIVMWMLDTFDPHLADIRSVMSMACQHGELYLVQFIIRQYGIRMFNIESMFDDACMNESSSLLEWLYQNFGNSHICNLNNFRNYSFRNTIFLIENRRINRPDYNVIFNHLCHLDSRMYMEYLAFFLDTLDHSLFDLKLIFNQVCRYGTTNFAIWIMDTFDQTLLDFQSAILEAAENFHFEIVTFLEKMKTDKKLNFDVHSVFLETCHHNENVQLVNWLLNNFENSMFSISEGISLSFKKNGYNKFIMNLIDRCEHNLIDFNIVMQAACRENASYRFKRELMGIADTSTIDVPFVVHQECNRSDPNWNFVKFMFTTGDCKIFDMKLIFSSACRTGEHSIVERLLHKFDTTVFDLKSGLNEACCTGRLSIVKLLVESFDTKNFDFHSAVQPTMNKYCVYLEFDEIVKYLLNNIQPSVSDLQCVMDRVCPTGNTVFVKWLIESFDCSELELNGTICRIFDEKQRCWEMLEMFLQSFDHERFDMMSIIIRANHRGYRELVSMMIKTVDHSFFDMKTVLLEICKEGDLETVTYLIETCHYEDLVDEAFILNAFRTGSSYVVKWLLRKRKEEIIDTKTAMSNACIGGNTQLVRYLLVKYNVKHFDLRSAINAASYYGRTEVVQLFLQVFHYETFDMDSVMCNAHVSGHIGLVKWLLGVYDHEIFNIESSVIEDGKNEKKKNKEEEEEEIGEEEEEEEVLY